LKQTRIANFSAPIKRLAHASHYLIKRIHLACCKVDNYSTSIVLGDYTEHYCTYSWQKLTKINLRELQAIPLRTNQLNFVMSLTAAAVSQQGESDGLW